MNWLLKRLAEVCIPQQHVSNIRSKTRRSHTSPLSGEPLIRQPPHLGWEVSIVELGSAIGTEIGRDECYTDMISRVGVRDAGM
jgi:hypothetical protein